MPMYETRHSGKLIGTYTAQRPACAATKAYTQLAKTIAITEPVKIEVCSTCKKKACIFMVEHKEVTDAFFGTMKRPVATKL
jgi:hypothetical protein